MKIYPFVIFVIFYFVKYGFAENLKLLILHNNDMHSRFEETSRTSGTCKDKTNCYGGFARVLHVIREARRAAADGTGPPVLYLNAGDTYTGTAWFSVHKWKIAADFLNLLHPDVATFGNHDFDYGVAGVVPFLNAISFPVVAANMNFSKEPSLLATNVTKSYVLEISGRKIGVIGYLTTETAEQSTPENVIFYDEIESVRSESERLAQDGIDIIIALGHSGYEVDKKIAEAVPLVDAVVGGHTNTFLSSKGQLDLEVPDGPYPTVITQVSGKKVPVVQAYGLTKYMGRLTLVFDDKGDLVEYEGEPQLLSPDVPQDADALRLLDKFRPAMDAINTDVIGLTRVELNGNLTKCRLGECNFINLITDSLVVYHLSKYDGYYWTDAAVALMNAGCVRNGIDRRINGTITKGDILTAMPFDDLVYTMVVTGKDLLDTLEVGVRGNGDASSGEAIHASGIFYTYDRSKKVGSRIIQAKIRCSLCRIPKYDDIDPEKTYKIIVPGFLSKGGDGHHVLKTNGFNKTIEDKSTWDAVQWYVKKMSPVFTQEEGRVVEYKSNETGSMIANCITILVLLIVLALL